MKNAISLFLILGFLPLSIQAQTAKEYYKNGLDLFEAKEYKKAEKNFNQAIALDSTKAEYYGALAYTLKLEEKYQEAMDLYVLAVDKFSDNAELLNDRGNYLLELKYYDYAFADFTEAIKYAKSDTLKFSIYTNRAAASFSQRDFESSYRDLIYAYKFDSTNIAVLNNLGNVCDEIGRGEETLKYLIKVTEIDPDFLPTYGNIGFKYQNMGKHEEAIEYFDMVIEKADGPEMRGVGHTNRSYSKMKLGDLKGALKDAELGVKLYEANSYAHKNLALVLLEKGKKKSACESLQNAIDQGFTLTYGEEVLEMQREHCK